MLRCDFSYCLLLRAHGDPDAGRLDDLNRLPRMAHGPLLAPLVPCATGWLMNSDEKMPFSLYL
jgi:hypothetical protein